MPDVQLRCKKCRDAFVPDLKTKGNWDCPKCDAKNPNLRRHYRSVADLCILGLIVSIVIVVLSLRQQHGLTVGSILGVLQAVLLVVTITSIYCAKTPWLSSRARVLIWVVFGSAFFFNVLAPLLFSGFLNVPFVIVYVFVFAYLFWLRSATNKCSL